MATRRSEDTVLEAKKAGQAAAHVQGGAVERRLHADGIRRRGAAGVLRVARETATQIMLKVHREGRASAASIRRTSRATKVEQVRILTPAPASAAVRDGRKDMIAQELEVSLHMAFMEARQKRHEFITVEHCCSRCCDNPSAAEVLRACAANIDELRKTLSDFVTEHTPTVAGHRRGRYAADARFPARDPARDPARAVARARRK